MRSIVTVCEKSVDVVRNVVTKLWSRRKDPTIRAALREALAQPRTADHWALTSQTKVTTQEELRATLADHLTRRRKFGRPRIFVDGRIVNRKLRRWALGIR